MDRSAVAKVKTNRKQRVPAEKREKPHRRGAGGRRKASRASDAMRPANDTDATPTPVADAAGPDEEMMAAGQGSTSHARVLSMTPRLRLRGHGRDRGRTTRRKRPSRPKRSRPRHRGGARGGRGHRRRRGKEGEEPQSFLAMYFRDMAELDVLRPEQEFETARHIEELELDLWRHLLSLPAGVPLGGGRGREGGHPAGGRAQGLPGPGREGQAPHRHLRAQQARQGRRPRSRPS